MISVLQDWVNTLPLQQQTCLLSSIRAADGADNAHINLRDIVKMYRRSVLNSAYDKAPIKGFTTPCEGGFMGPVRLLYGSEESVKAGKAVIKKFFDEEVDRLTTHYFQHLLHAVLILAYKHPDAEYREVWGFFITKASKYLHVKFETQDELDSRLSDIFDD